LKAIKNDIINQEHLLGLTWKKENMNYEKCPRDTKWRLFYAVGA